MFESSVLGLSHVAPLGQDIARSTKPRFHRGLSHYIPLGLDGLGGFWFRTLWLHHGLSHYIPLGLKEEMQKQFCVSLISHDVIRDDCLFAPTGRHVIGHGIAVVMPPPQPCPNGAQGVNHGKTVIRGNHMIRAVILTL